MKNNLEKHVEEYVEKLTELCKLNLIYLQSRIDLVIEEKVTDVSEIEFLLDQTLDLMFLGMGEPEFLKLYTHYATNNPTNKALKFYAAEYEKIVENWKN